MAEQAKIIGGVSVWSYEDGLIYKLHGSGDLNGMWLELPGDAELRDLGGITSCVRSGGRGGPYELNYLIRAGIITPRPDMYNPEQFPPTVKGAVILEKIFLALGQSPPEYVLQAASPDKMGGGRWADSGTCRHCGGAMSPGRSLSLTEIGSGDSCLSCGRSR